MPQAEAPVWQVGDNWAMGTGNIDLGSMLNAIMENAKSKIPGAQDITYSASGSMAFYVIYRVENVSTEQYTVSLTENGHIDMSFDMSGTYQGQQGSIHIKMTMAMNVHGFLYFTKDDLKLARIEMTIENMNMVLTGEMEAGDYSQPLDMSFEASGDIDMTCDPPLNMFDFPISVGDNWNINSTATMSGSMTIKIVAPNENEQQQNVPLTGAVPISISASCPNRKNITLPGGSTTNAYKIVYSSASMGGANPFFGASVLYYSPDTGFIVSSEVSLGNALSGISSEMGGQPLSGLPGLDLESIMNQKLTMNPMTEEEAISGASGQGGDSTVLLVAVVVPVIVVVVVVTVFLFKRAIST
jgi:hypothetical protein